MKIRVSHPRAAIKAQGRPRQCPLLPWIPWWRQLELAFCQRRIRRFNQSRAPMLLRQPHAGIPYDRRTNLGTWLTNLNLGARRLMPHRHWRRSASRATYPRILIEGPELALTHELPRSLKNSAIARVAVAGWHDVIMLWCCRGLPQTDRTRTAITHRSM
jgi:hypothetical protein